jgi:hypothetical protein
MSICQRNIALSRNLKRKARPVCRSKSAIRRLYRLSIHGVGKTDETGRPCRMVAVRKDLAVHGLEGDLRHGGQVKNCRQRSADCISPPACQATRPATRSFSR